MTKKLVLAAAVFLGVSTFGGPEAFAQQAGKVITIGEVTIVGRVQKPIASVDVSKIQPKLTLAELRAYRPEVEEPADFDGFWAGQLEAAAAVPLDPAFSPVGSAISMG